MRSVVGEEGIILVQMGEIFSQKPNPTPNCKPTSQVLSISKPLDFFQTQKGDNRIQSESRMSESIARNEELCTLCEEFTSQAIYYIGENETQVEIINTLHQACSQLHSLEKQCALLVDYYAPLFFMEVATIRPEQFCEKVNLCEKTVSVPLPKHDDACTICHHVVEEILTKLEDPDTQLEIIARLLKACNKVENFVQQCKRLVFQYGPLIMANLVKFLETTDVCTSIHACKASQEVVGRSEFLAIA
ncbi:proactivator polypeptide-like 1 [Cocos nucifera]|uniref:Pulmonary surfactant-associated protein B n=1 Tax=Cocos nucifera TaxID=13894 RepID=A0A8K0N0R8_COCNU|nr:proactivator polypeptide-like 1 [Cocos nucifera]